MRPGRLGLLAAAGLAGLTLLRLLMAAITPLAPDEAYYWVWSRALAPGYFDHPPMVALWVRAGAALAGTTPLGVRLLGPLSAALGSVLLWDAGERLVPGRGAGLAAAALLNATLLFGVGSVVMGPDTPLLFFCTLALWSMARLLAGGGGWLLMAGLAAGLALASKYTAVFLAPGLAACLLAAPETRRWWRTPWPWLGGAAGAAAIAPLLLWNARHGWVSFLKQGGRTGAWQPSRALQFLGELVGGQIGLATPLVFLLLAAGVAAMTSRAWRTRAPAPVLLAGLALPPVLVFIEHALGDRVQGNWPAILYPPAAVAGGALTGWRWVRLRGPAVGLGLAITAAAYIQATLAPVSVPGVVDPAALRLAGWSGLAAEVESARRAAGARFVAADNYGVAAELAWTLPQGVEVIGVDPRWPLFALPAPAIAGEAGLLVRSARRGDDVDRLAWASAEEIGAATRRGRDGGVVEAFRLFLVRGRPGPLAAAQLPRP